MMLQSVGRSRYRVEKKSKGVAYRRSRQRSRILELLQGSAGHPTAAWLYDKLRKEFPGLSIGTIYRNLGILEDQGLIKRIDVGGAAFDRFEAKIEPHYHFVCDSCGSIIDLELPVDESLNERVNLSSEHRALRHDIQFHGICATCAARGTK